MATNNYTTKTAALKATKADINKIDAKKMLLNGKNILDYISDSEFDSYDTRDPQLKNDELDIWNTGISLSEEGHIEVKPHVHSIKCNEDTDWEFVYEGITESQVNTLQRAVKVIDNEVLGENDAHLMYWQTNGLTEDQYGIFMDCYNLTSFNSDLSSLTSGYYMFTLCYNLTSFTSDLHNLTYGENMFGRCEKLTSFTSDLSSLTDGHGMFFGCLFLSQFTSDLPNLTNGQEMFSQCVSIKSFTTALPSLTNGEMMFSLCKLDAKSVANIVHTLPTHESNGTITIGIGCDNNGSDADAFAQECDCETWQELLDDFSAKNWTVTFQCNGRPTTSYGMRRGETLPIYTKLVEVIMPTDEKERKPHYAYTSADGSKFYNISYFHSTNGSTEGYDVFSSLEEAISTYNVTPKN